MKLQEKEYHAFKDIVTENEKMYELFYYCKAVSKSPEPILITGETGTGKELFAKAIHRASGVDGKFIPVNVAGLDDAMFSDTLFGHTKGAFTGALDTRVGLLEQAEGGTIFLDEIGDLDVNCQLKLLRLLQDNKYYALGADRPKTLSAKIVLATNKSIRYLQYSEKFRNDLFFRISVHNVNIPPLRKRNGDIKILFDHFLKESAAELNKKMPHVPQDIISYLKTYDFMGNVRELRAMIYNAVSLHRSKKMSLSYFRDYIETRRKHQMDNSVKPYRTITLENAVGKFPTLKEMEEILLCEALEKCDGNQKAAAGLLGISRQTLNRKFQAIKIRQNNQ